MSGAGVDAVRLVEELCGAPDAAAVRVVDVLHAHAAAVAWLGAVTGIRPTPAVVQGRLTEAAARLRSGEDRRDPYTVLVQVAAAARVELRACPQASGDQSAPGVGCPEEAVR